MCFNLRNKNYCIRNKQYSREDYIKIINDFNLGSFVNIKQFKNEFGKLIKNGIHKYTNITNSVNSSGDNILNSRNAKISFFISGADNVKYCWRMFGNLKDSYDVTGGLSNELVYESSLAADEGYLTKFFSRRASELLLKFSVEVLSTRLSANNHSDFVVVRFFLNLINLLVKERKVRDSFLRKESTIINN